SRAVSSDDPAGETVPIPPDNDTQAVEPGAPALEQPAQPAEAPNIAKPSPRPVAAPSNPDLDASYLSRTVDVLVSTQAGYQQKRSVKIGIGWRGDRTRAW